MLRNYHRITLMKYLFYWKTQVRLKQKLNHKLYKNKEHFN